MGKILIVIGAVIALAGLLVLAGIPLGKLPGDISYKGDRFQFYLPITTSILISAFLSIILYLFSNK